MTDTEFKNLKKKLQKLINWWTSALGLRWWKLTFEYARSSDDYNDESQEGVFVGAARTVVKWEYGHAIVTFNMPQLPPHDDDELEYILVHELMHIFVAEMRDCMLCNCGPDMFDVKHEERVVTQLAKAAQWTRDATKRDMQRAHYSA